ncbi:hypothetical protein PS1_024793 [Malus domestica]
METQWSLPPAHYVKINVDASQVASSGKGFVGLVARDSDGKFLAARRQAFMAMCVSQAKTTTFLHGYELGFSQDFRYIILESDSLESISCLNDNLDNGSWMAYPILAKVKNFRDSFQACCWSWTPRSADKEANLLASQKLKEMCNVLWVDRPSSFLVFVLNNDGLLCPH